MENNYIRSDEYMKQFEAKLLSDFDRIDNKTNKIEHRITMIEETLKEKISFNSTTSFSHEQLNSILIYLTKWLFFWLILYFFIIYLLNE